MKWFKHSAGSLNNSFISELIETFGGDGYLCFFGVLELMSDEFDIYSPGKLTLSLKKITRNLQLSRQKTVRILKYCDKKAKENLKKDVAFHATIEGNKVHLNCPKLKKLCDEYTNKLIKDVSGVTPELLPSDSGFTAVQEEEVEEEVDIEEDIKETPPPKYPNCPHSKILEIYHEKLQVLPKVLSFNKILKAKLQTRWKEDKKRENIEWWEWYFQGVSECDFLMGKVKEWKADFDWLIGPKNMTNVLNGRYLNKQQNGNDEISLFLEGLNEQRH